MPGKARRFGNQFITQPLAEWQMVISQQHFHEDFPQPIDIIWHGYDTAARERVLAQRAHHIFKEHG